MGDMCPHADLNRTATAPDGTAIRCLSGQGGYSWVVDTGVTQVDPAIAGQQGWADCMQSHTAAQCRNIVDAAPLPPTQATVTTIPGEGTYQVGVDINPGLYVSRGGLGGLSCVWFRHQGLGLGSSDIIDSGVSTGPQYVRLPVSDGSFETSNCQTWTATPG